MPGTVNPDASLIPDEAEVWLALASDVTSPSTLIPPLLTTDLSTIGWTFVGYIDDKKGIPLDPSIEVRNYDAFGHPKFRKKLKNGDLTTGFTALEINAVTKKICLPGSAANKRGMPQNIQVYVLYRVVDEDTAAGTMLWATLTKAPIELKATSGFVEGEEWWAEFVVHHTTDAANDVFQVVDSTTDDVTKTYTIGTGVTGYTTTVTGQTTPSITTLTAAALQTALRALSSVAALPSPGATVTGTGGAPGTLTAVFTAAVTGVSATGTGGTVTVA
jgi:hypothetical protein